MPNTTPRNPHGIIVRAMAWHPDRDEPGRSFLDLELHVPTRPDLLNLDAVNGLEEVIGDYLTGRTKSRYRRVWEALTRA